MRIKQAPGWHPICSNNLLSFFIGIHAVEMTSYGFKMNVGTARNDVECLGESK